MIIEEELVTAAANIVKNMAVALIFMSREDQNMNTSLDS